MAAAAAVEGHFVDIRQWNYKVGGGNRRRCDREVGVPKLVNTVTLMLSFTVHTGRVLPLDRPNVDTDQIIPKQFLKRIERTGFGQYLFFDWRFLEDGSDNPEFELNRPRISRRSVLLARRNFGCGSSREHAPGHWKILAFGC